MQRFTAIGNVGKDPEIREFNNGNRVANFTLATKERGFTAKDGTVVPDITDWHLCQVNGGLVNVVESYVKKGDKLYIEGKMRTRSYKDNDGVERHITECRVDSIEMLGSPKENTQSNFGKAKVQDKVYNKPAGQNTQVKDDLPF